MKLLINIVRVLVGLLFIFSGLIKANDPLGLSYKMQEFFELWGMEQFNGHTLWLSVVMIAFEIIAGVALLLGWRMKLFIWLLLLLIVFFTFLTGYAFLSGKFKNCGCFGDCIPITPLTSFLKDVILTVMILFLFRHRDKINPLFSNKLNVALMVLGTVFSFGVQWYMLNYLPLFDCLAYKKNYNIKDKMKVPEGAITDSFAIRFIYQKDGKDVEFAPENLPADLGSYTYKSREDKLIRKGNAEPPIKGFTLSGITDADSTDVVLSQPRAILLFAEDFSTPVSAWKADFEKLYASAKAKNIPVYAITGRSEEAKRQFAATSFGDIQIFTCDNTAIRTASRTNPSVYLLKEGTIVEKQSYKRMEKITSLIQ
ncbi:DoxX family protein [Terrimonas sp. NA20]|uniref:DoxX family protein n=1 Tax=Terrimonas ginsenosidimutans TaxID=2908004 RepID=A0ABS9KMN7_9BACT|nr:BT_3928 family protein [Terrimonas ginsenosidimutans]MCG2613595.1 DoxX family protein [Terrimonas ginsenosidimutans]